jgi:hypothetical protein
MITGKIISGGKSMSAGTDYDHLIMPPPATSS